jgi:hypothetical protein
LAQEKPSDWEFITHPELISNRFHKRRNLGMDRQDDSLVSHAATLSSFSKYARKRRKLKSLVAHPLNRTKQLEETYRSIDL